MKKNLCVCGHMRSRHAIKRGVAFYCTACKCPVYFNSDEDRLLKEGEGMAKTEKETFEVMGDYVFTEVEKKQIAQDLANKSLEIQALEDEKKAVMSSFKAKIDAATATVNLSATHLSRGRMQKFYKCTLEFDRAKKLRLWKEVENGTVIKTEPMQSQDFQLKLPRV